VKAAHDLHAGFLFEGKRMREFLDEILEFIGSETLTDEEFDDIDLSVEEYSFEVYVALRTVLEGRENVSTQVRKLKAYFQARDVDLESDSVIPTANSNILIGGGVDD
jgi:hypothetical protein